MTIAPDTSRRIETTDHHRVKLAELGSIAERVRYACEFNPDGPRTDAVRQWLSAYGHDTKRPYVSTLVTGYRTSRSMSDTGDLPALTPAVMAELDAANPSDATAPAADVDQLPAPAVLAPAAPVDLLPAPPADVAPLPAPAADVDQVAPARPPLTGIPRVGAAVLLTLVAVLLTGVIVAPIALSSQDIIDWAGSPLGLGLDGAWPWITFLALDAAAAVCVCLVVYCAWRGESAGVFGWMVWTFAGMSAFANYQHSSAPGAPGDAVWFFPAMSLAGPFLLEMIIRRVRKWVQEGTGQRARHSVSFGFARWVPGVGALRETYGAWRLARLDGINDARQAIEAYRVLCPDGSIRVLKALRNRG